MIPFKPLFQIPSCLQHLYSGVLWRGDTSSKCIYLTFDDGPVPQVTPQVLDILDCYGVRATFFMVGENVSRYPDLARDVFLHGHMIGNHTYNHLCGLKTDDNRYFANVKKCDETIFHTLNHFACSFSPVSVLFRPPHGRTKPSQRRWLRSHGYQMVLWDVLTHDYNPSYTSDDILNIVQRYTRNGSVIVFHDSIKSVHLLQTLPVVIEYLKNKGYEFRTL